MIFPLNLFFLYHSENLSRFFGAFLMFFLRIPGHKKLTGADVVEGEGLDLGDVDAHLPVDPRALDAHDNT